MEGLKGVGKRSKKAKTMKKFQELCLGEMAIWKENYEGTRKLVFLIFFFQISCV